MKAKTRVIFYHHGAHQHIADVDASDLLAAINLAITDIVARGDIDVDSLLHWTNFEGNTVVFLRID